MKLWKNSCKIFFQIIGGAISMRRETTPYDNPYARRRGWRVPPGWDAPNSIIHN
jgi:hypothetical protein